MNTPSIDTIQSLSGSSPDLIINSIAGRVRQRRLELNLTQKALASRAGIPLPTYRKFESSGEISLRRLVMIGWAMDMTDEFSALFATKVYRSIDELLAGSKAKNRKRAGAK